MWRQDVFANAAALDTDSSNGPEAPIEGDLLTPEPVLQRGWLNWLSLGLLGASDSPESGQIFPQEIIKVGTLIFYFLSSRLYIMPAFERRTWYLLFQDEYEGRRAAIIVS